MRTLQSFTVLAAVSASNRCSYEEDNSVDKVTIVVVDATQLEPDAGTEPARLTLLNASEDTLVHGFLCQLGEATRCVDLLAGGLPPVEEVSAWVMPGRYAFVVVDGDDRCASSGPTRVEAGQHYVFGPTNLPADMDWSTGTCR